MGQRVDPIFFALLRSAICGAALTEAEKAEFSTEQLGGLLSVAKTHDVAHLLAPRKMLRSRQSFSMPFTGMRGLAMNMRRPAPHSRRRKFRLFRLKARFCANTIPRSG